MSKPQVILWGASSTGHGAVVLDAVLSADLYDVVGFVDDNPANQGKLLHGYPILGGREYLGDVDKDTRVFPAVGDNRLRLEMQQFCADRGITLATAVHSTAYVALGSIVDEGAFVAAGAVVGAGARIGKCCIVNTLASADHNVIMEAGSNISPGVHLAGRVRVGEGAFLGTGASVIPDIGIGDWATVGAGAVVIRNVPAGVSVMGVPAVEGR